jgi:hypothetical protein
MGLLAERAAVRIGWVTRVLPLLIRIRPLSRVGILDWVSQHFVRMGILGKVAGFAAGLLALGIA